MARKCASNKDNCNCSFRYPDDGDFVAGSGTADSPFVLSDCNPMFRIRDCDASNNSVECGEIVSFLSGINRDNRRDYPDGGSVSVDGTGIYFGNVTSILAGGASAFFNEEAVYNINRIGDPSEPVNCLSTFDLDVKNSAPYTFHMTMEICQEIPAPTVSGGECGKIFLALSNKFGSVGGDIVEEEFNAPYWYPPTDPNSRGCQTFNWAERVFLPAGFYNELCLSVSYNRRYDELNAISGPGNCFMNPSRKLYVNNALFSITS